MRHVLTPTPSDTIGVADDWGYPSGLQIGDITLHLLSDERIAQMQRALDDLRDARAKVSAEREAECDLGEPELAGFEHDEAAA